MLLTVPAADRFALANGCFSVTDSSGARVADSVFMKPTDLGRYLLLKADRTFVAAQDGKLATATEPGPAADFTLEDAGADAFRLVPQSTGAAAATVTFAPAQGCWATRRGRVRAVGITTSRFASDRRAVRSAMRRIAARADDEPGEFVPAGPSAKSSMLGRPLASSGDRKVDQRMALDCSLDL